MKEKINLTNVYSYFIGNYRYYLYYKPSLKWLIRKHIYEQIEARINSMNRECYNNGQCKMCGCSTTALQMANKACDKPCYPEIVSKYRWNKLKNRKIIYSTETNLCWMLRNNKFKPFTL